MTPMNVPGVSTSLFSLLFQLEIHLPAVTAGYEQGHCLHPRCFPCPGDILRGFLEKLLTFNSQHREGMFALIKAYSCVFKTEPRAPCRKRAGLLSA